MAQAISGKATLFSTVHDQLASFETSANSGPDRTIARTLHLAQYLQRRAHLLQTPQERKQQMELDRMIQNPHDKATLMQLTDQAFRSQASARAVDQLIHILDVQGVPRFFSPLDRTLLKGFQSFGAYLPGVAVPLVKEKMRRETANVVLPAEHEHLVPHLLERRLEGVRMNINFLGEAILSEQEAQRRLEQYLAALQMPEIEVVSIKISTIFSQISTVDRQGTVDMLSDRLELLYRAAQQGEFRRANGEVVPKFVYLDMEEYRDMWLTAAAFMNTLDRPGLEEVTAGIALQAYLPDSYLVQQRITEWAQQRVARGGRPVTIRIVKGANLEMERVEAALMGWQQAPFTTKQETDANYKRMVQYALEPTRLRAVKPGIASHNLFDVAYALVLAYEQGVLDQLQFEMLEGMANHQRRAVHELTQNVLLYAPTCEQADFANAIAYLIRRLDENTGEENFLRHAFRITVDSQAWKLLEQNFLGSFQLIPSLTSAPRRTQDRRQESQVGTWDASGTHLTQPSPDGDERAGSESAADTLSGEGAFSECQSTASGNLGAPSSSLAEIHFENEPDTDFSLPHHAEWAQSILAHWQARSGERAIDVPLIIGGEKVTEPRDEELRYDPSRPGIVVNRSRLATADDVERAVEIAAEDPAGWRQMPVAERRAILRRVAQELRQGRADLMGAAAAAGGKLLTESDPEVSEAVDFVEFYSQMAVQWENLSGLEATPRGVVVVVSPWNFPIAIPCGGIAASLAAGNTVILKPASYTVLVAHLLCECFYQAGVPRSALQLIPCRGSTVGQRLVTHPRVDTVILTGGTQTARQMLAAHPDMRLFAETGGKNATVVTALADRDQAIKHVLHSAFSHSGQKCSATSLLLLEQEIYDDLNFRRSLVEAVSSLQVGSVWDPQTRIGPLIAPPTHDLEQGLKVLEPGESWALMPEPDPDNHQLYSPGIKWNIEVGGYTHCTEFFGPVLGVLPFRGMDEAIHLVNLTGYGLTSGLESLDDREQQTWMQGLRAGNLYINRPTTGAIVLRQPFGGQGLSSVGPGIKAGGPNYLVPLYRFSTKDLPATSSIELPALQDLFYELLSFKTDEPTVCPLTSAPRSAEHLTIGEAEWAKVRAAIASYDYQARTEFLAAHDHFQLLGQHNIRRYRPVEGMLIRVAPGDSWFDIVARAAAARAVGCHTILSAPPGVATDELALLHRLTESWGAEIEFIEQTDDALIAQILDQEVSRLRYAAPDRVAPAVRQAANEQLIYIADAPVLPEGRVELLWYVWEQSLSVNYHRYGNVSSRRPLSGLSSSAAAPA